MKAPRQSDVARLAGVSQSAVSRVVSGEVDRIPVETRDRILAAVKELGYVPNAAARNLRNKRNRLLGVHTFESVFPHAREDFYFEFLLGIEERAEEIGYDLVLFTSTGTSDGRRRIYRDGTNRLNLADGTVLLGAATDREELARLWHDGYLFVHIGRREVPGARSPASSRTTCRRPTGSSRHWPSAATGTWRTCTRESTRRRTPIAGRDTAPRSNGLVCTTARRVCAASRG